MVAISS